MEWGFPWLQAVKARLEQERDLDGIDSTNIVAGGRRSRTAASKRINYTCVLPTKHALAAELSTVPGHRPPS